MALKSIFPSAWNDSTDNHIFRDLHNAIDNVFADFRGLSPRHPRSTISELGSVGFNYPRIDISEENDTFQVEVELPGIEQKDVAITLEGDCLVITGERESEKESKEKNYHLVERSRGSFKRTIPLGFNADVDSVDANFSKGLLTVLIPKPAEVTNKAKKIEIKEELPA